MRPPFGSAPFHSSSPRLPARSLNRRTALSCALVPLSFALATMPNWWPDGYTRLLALPGIGYFRVPARYTLITSLGLAILAGDGLDRSISKTQFRTGLLDGDHLRCARGAGGLSLDAAPGRSPPLASGWHSSTGSFGPWRPGAWRASPWRRGIEGGSVRAPWSRRTGVELAILFHCGTTEWGWSIRLEKQSPFWRHSQPSRTSGSWPDRSPICPSVVGLRTASPQLGFALPAPDDLLKLIQERLALVDVDPRRRPAERGYGQALVSPVRRDARGRAWTALSATRH